MEEVWVVTLGEFQGCRCFTDEGTANEEAERLTRITGKKWTARKLLRKT